MSKKARIENLPPETLANDTVESIQKVLDAYPKLLKRHMIPCSNASTTGSFSIMQFNILADCLCSDDSAYGFIAAPKKSLTWDFRKYRLLEEILTHKPDLLVLEECDHFDDWFLPKLRLHDYDGLFKTKEEKTDGTAIFFKKTMFSLKQHLFEPITEGRRHVYGSAILCHKPTGNHIALVGSHLLATKTEEGEATRATQAVAILNKLKKIVDTWNEQQPKPDTMIKGYLFVGDLNAQPIDDKYKALMYPKLDLEQKKIALPILSAYVDERSENLDGSKEPRYTTWKKRPGHVAKMTIDYIFHSPSLEVTKRLSIPTEEEVPEERFPTFAYASDHLAIMAEFGWI
eukprot:m.76253 g.76253  ORF g.76253 m.76253 type:complete len:344 (+) comp20585_c0_seq1:66-1097(+)